MTAASQSRPAFRLSWPALLAGMISMLALFAREQFILSPLPLLALALPASRFTDRRLEDAGATWLLRLLLFGCVIAIGLLRSFPPDTSGLYDPRTLCLIGELFAVELTLQVWRRRPAAGGQGIVLILLSGLILLPASDSTEDRAIWFFAPAYALCMALALPLFRSPKEGGALSTPYRRSVGAWIALGLALSFGAAGHFLFRTFQSELTQFGMQMLHETQAPEPTGALSTDPELGPNYGLEGSDARAFRIEESREGNVSFEHLRAMAFDAYVRGRWLPRAEVRASAPATARDLSPAATGGRLRVTRLMTNGGLLVAPLNTAGMDLAGQGVVNWSRAMGPLKTDAPVPSTYSIIVGSEEHQGPFCTPPDAAERRLLLAAPKEIDPRVEALARQVIGGATTPSAKVEAIAAYLPSAHGYSLKFQPGRGDPVSSFLLGRKPAHCEYFASAAVLLLRCVGVPARYVIGYYAHERDPSGVTIVRQRDAHAWAEAWIDGKGWMTVDATPASGRPDRTGGAPWWTRWIEWLQDSLSALSSRFGRAGLPAVLVLMGVAATVIAWRNRPRRGLKQPASALSYASPDEELVALAARFERACRRQGVIYPPNVTWQEALIAAPPPADPKQPFDSEAARAFVRAYNAARWGGADARSLQELKTLLNALESFNSRFS